jgi:TRAP-type C4-dicarboxylate transport system permease small subunit
MMVGSVFIGGAVATYRLRLIGVDAFIGMVPESVARWLRVVAHILTLMLAVLLAWKSIRLIELGMRQTSPAMEMPMAYIYVFMFIGCVLMSLNTFAHVIKELMSVEASQQGGETERAAAAMQNSEGGAL